MIKHDLEITFRPKRVPLVECHTQPVSRRLWRRLFGERQKVVVLFPGDTVDRKEIFPQEKFVALRLNLTVQDPANSPLEIIEKLAPDPPRGA